MVQLHQDIKKFQDKKIRVVAICPESQERIEKYLAKESLDFDLVSDSDHQLADCYGQQVKVLKLGRMPAQLVLDGKGHRIVEHYARNMTDILENQQILETVPKI